MPSDGPPRRSKHSLSSRNLLSFTVAPARLCSWPTRKPRRPTRRRVAWNIGPLGPITSSGRGLEGTGSPIGSGTPAGLASFLFQKRPHSCGTARGALGRCSYAFRRRLSLQSSDHRPYCGMLTHAGSKWYSVSLLDQEDSYHS